MTSPVRFAAELAVRGPVALARTGLLTPPRPDHIPRMASAALAPTPGLGGLVSALARRYPDRPAIIDDDGAITYAQLDTNATRLANALAHEHGIGPDAPLGLMARNHRGFVEALLAASRTGADTLLLNTDFAGPQLQRVLERDQPKLVIADDEFAPLFADYPSISDMRPLKQSNAPRAKRHRRPGTIVLLTSGTTGTPKGVGRSRAGITAAGFAVSALERLGFRAGRPMLVCPPFFHGFGLGMLGMGLILGAPVVCSRRFDPEGALRAIEAYRVHGLAAVPVMMQRILALDPATRAKYDTSSLRTCLSAAAPLNADLATAFMDAFGDIVRDAYGSTEVGFATIATPADIRAAPGNVGTAALGIEVRILDEQRRPCPTGETGHIFIKGPLNFDGYTGGGSKEVADGAMNTGDMGHLDAHGRLFIDGREDDMIISGGENVFPSEVEECLRAHPEVSDVAVVGVADANFGQRLAAFVVGSTDDADALKQHVRAQLARYKVPRDITFVDEIPRNPTGKILRRKLAS